MTLTWKCHKPALSPSPFVDWYGDNYGWSWAPTSNNEGVDLKRWSPCPLIKMTLMVWPKKVAHMPSDSYQRSWFKQPYGLAYWLPWPLTHSIHDLDLKRWHHSDLKEKQPLILTTYLLSFLKHPEERGHGTDIQSVSAYTHYVVEDPCYLPIQCWKVCLIWWHHEKISLWILEGHKLFQ